MKIKLLIIFSAFAILLTPSCDNGGCSNQDELLIYNNNYKAIPDSALQSIGKILDYLQISYCENGEKALPVIYYDMKNQKIANTPGKHIIPINIEPVICSGQPQYDFNRILEIILDGNNILIEGIRMPLDSIPQYVYYQYLNFGKKEGFSQMPQGNGIWLITEYKRPVTDFNTIIGKIIQGYIETVSIYCDAIFDKKICDLSEGEMEKLKNQIQFHLSFKYSDQVGISTEQH